MCGERCERVKQLALLCLQYITIAEQTHLETGTYLRASTNVIELDNLSGRTEE